MPTSIHHIPEHVLLHISTYLAPHELLTFEQCCTQFRLSCQQFDRAIYEHLIDLLWRNYENNKPSTNQYNILDRIKSLSLATLKKNLVGVDLTRCVEKIDFQRMLLANMLFKPRMQKELTGNDPRFRGRYVSMYYPEWALKIGEYKASYLWARKEVSRQEILISELVRIEWIFRFKPRVTTVEIDPSMTWRARFNPDYTMISEMSAEIYTWQVFKSEENPELNGIQVNQYPPLRSSRRPCGKWRLENAYVIFDQEQSLDPDNLPLF